MGRDLDSLRCCVQLVDACTAPEESSGQLQPTCPSRPASRGYVCPEGSLFLTLTQTHTPAKCRRLGGGAPSRRKTRQGSTLKRSAWSAERPRMEAADGSGPPGRPSSVSKMDFHRWPALRLRTRAPGVPTNPRSRGRGFGGQKNTHPGGGVQKAAMGLETRSSKA